MKKAQSITTSKGRKRFRMGRKNQQS